MTILYREIEPYIRTDCTIVKEETYQIARRLKSEILTLKNALEAWESITHPYHIGHKSFVNQDSFVRFNVTISETTFKAMRSIEIAELTDRLEKLQKRFDELTDEHTL